ncbi:MAG: VWA domain-containing protein [Pseudomonadota bacterium]
MTSSFLVKLGQAFAASRSGSFAVIFALALLPLIAAAGAALDYARAVNVRSDLQRAIDAVALAAGTGLFDRANGTFDEDAARAFFDVNFGEPEGEISSFTITKSATTVEVSVAGRIETTLLATLGIQEIPFSSDAQARLAQATNFEIVLVLDNTGSMGGNNKLKIMQDAATMFIDRMETLADGMGIDVQIGIVPFTEMVRLDTDLKSEPWLDLPTQQQENAWTGCLWDRDQPYDADITAPNPGIAASLFTPHPNAGFNPARCRIAEIEPLTDDYNKLRDHVDDMIAAGTTNVGLGMVWGWHLLNPSTPFTGARPETDEDYRKIMIVLTDGDNTRTRRRTQYGASLDANTEDVCDNLDAEEITRYTIRVVNGNANLLRRCASDPDKFYNVRQPRGIVGVFEEIASLIESETLRLSS